MVANPAEDQSETIAFLSRPESYGLPPTSKIKRIDTHGAVVFLVGDRAYKLKRAVAYPYMDFSTRERRLRCCADEVSVNRRTAEQFYLGVAPVVISATGDLAIGPVSEPGQVRRDAVDWVVVMRRFDRSQLLAKLARRGELNAATVSDLARGVAAYHAAAAPAPGHGGADWLVHSVDMDVGQMKARGTLLDPALSDRLGALMPPEAARWRELSDRRLAAGAVRRCHGDLHLSNIFLENGRPVPFDAIEFNDRLSCIDVLYDLAFLLMDLDFRGLRPLANLALNQYLWAATGPDDELLSGLALLPIFLARRASIRAHVDAAGIPLIADGKVAAAARSEARAYQQYACALFDPSPPRLVAIGGLSGTGKTTLAMALAPWISPTPGAVVLRTDVIRKRLAGIPLDEPMPPGSYARQKSARVYDEVHRLAAVALAAGRSVVLDGVYADAGERNAACAVADVAGVRFAGLWLEAALPELMKRVDTRRGDASDATAAVVARQAGYDPGHIGWHRLDAGGGVEALTRAAWQYVTAPADD